MSKTNCINCGSAKDTSEIRCPFCGTTYLDFTAIDFSSDDPVVCQFVLPYSDKQILSMVAIPQLNNITLTSSNISFTDGLSSHSSRYITDNYDMDVGISFKPLIRKDGSIFSIKTEP